MRTTFVPVCMLAMAAAAWSCSSSSSNGSSAPVDGGDAGEADSVSGSSSGGGVDATIDVVDNPSNCVKPGTASNAQGVGGYCNSGGGQCTSAGPGGAPTLCSADFDGVNNAWFCTVICSAGTACGPGASCTATTGGSYCVPSACLGVLADAGALDTEGGIQHEAGSEGSVEASAGDSATHDAEQDGPAAD